MELQDLQRRWKRFLSSYYIFNILGLATYFLLRRRFESLTGNPGYQRTYFKSTAELWHWEKRSFWMLLALSSGRYIQRTTIDTYIAEMLGYYKLVACVLLCSADFRLGVILLLLYSVLFLLFLQPKYDGPQHVDVLTPASLKGQVLSKVEGAVWFVMFTAPWSVASSQAQATFAELSLEYASGNLRFAEIDVGRWPGVAAQFQVSIDALPHQLPTFLLFRQGNLKKRMPEAGESWDRKGKLRDRLVKSFDLDVLLASNLQYVKC